MLPLKKLAEFDIYYYYYKFYTLLNIPFTIKCTFFNQLIIIRRAKFILFTYSLLLIKIIITYDFNIYRTVCYLPLLNEKTRNL